MFIYQSLFLSRGTDNHKAKPLCYLCFISVVPAQFFPEISTQTVSYIPEHLSI
jgi:hypothetical protein